MERPADGSKLPPDAPEADALEQERTWTDDEPNDVERPKMPPDAPEADVLEQSRPAALDDEEHEG